MTNVLNNLDCLISWKNKSGRYWGCNDAFVAFMGLPFSQAIVGKTDADLAVINNPNNTYFTNDDDIIDTRKEEVVREKQLQFLDSTQKTFLTKKFPLKNEDGALISYCH